MKDEKKKLVYVLHSIEVGGVEVALLSSIPALAEKYDLKIIVLGKINHSLIQHLTIKEKNTFQTFSYPVYLYPFFINKIVKIILSFNPYYLICSLWRASLVGRIVKKRNKKIKLIVFIHSVRFFHKADKFFTSRAIIIADRVFADSNSSQTFVKQHFGYNQDVTIISFLTHTTPSFRIRKEFGVKDRIKIISLGRLDKVKNLPLSIKVVSQLRSLGYNITLDVFGRFGNAHEETVSAVQNYNLKEFVTLKGEVPPSEKFSLFKQYDFYIQLSKFEGMAMSVAEAMQYSLPCIVSPVGEIPNYSKDMESAIFIDIWNTEKFELSIRKIESVIRNPALYSKISKDCWMNFKDGKKFSESLIENLESR